jgi:antitoxin MazE
MDATIQKWGNSNAIRLPKPILKTANMCENDIVRITAVENRIVISKSKPPHMTFKERMQGFDSIYEPAFDDVAPVGTERFWADNHE